jgi:hypothetical protein
MTPGWMIPAQRGRKSKLKPEKNHRTKEAQTMGPGNQNRGARRAVPRTVHHGEPQQQSLPHSQSNCECVAPDAIDDRTARYSRNDMIAFVDGSTNMSPEAIRIFSDHTFPIALSIVLLLAIGLGGRMFFDRFFKKWDDYHAQMKSVDQHLVANTASNDALKGSVDKLSAVIQDRRVDELKDKVSDMQGEVGGLKATVERAVTELQEHRNISRASQVSVVGVAPVPPSVVHQSAAPNSAHRASSAGISCG